MKKIIILLLVLSSVVLSETNLFAPSGSYFLGDDVFIYGNYKGNCEGVINVTIDGNLIRSKNYSFVGVTDLKTVFPKKLNVSLGNHLIKISSSCFNPIYSNFEVKNNITINYELNSFNFMTGEKVKLKAYGLKGTQITNCKIFADKLVFEKEMKHSFKTNGTKIIKIKCEDEKGNKGEKEIKINVYNQLKGKITIEKTSIDPSEKIKLNLSVLDYFNKPINYEALAYFNNKNYEFKKINSTLSHVEIPVNEKQPPGDYELKVIFVNGSNKGEKILTINVLNIVKDVKIITDEKKSNENETFVKIVVLNQNNDAFEKLINVTIISKGKKIFKEVKSNKYFSVPVDSVLKIKQDGINYKKTLNKDNKQINDRGTGLATAGSKNFNSFLIGSVLFVLIVGSILFLRNSELAVKV